MADRSIVTRLRAEVGQYKQAMDEAAKSTRQVGDEQDKTNSKSKENSKSSEEAARKAKESADQQREAWNMVGTSLLAVGTGITALGVSMLKTGIEYNTLQQTTRAALTTLLGSASAAGDQMDRLDEFARNSPFSKATFITAQQQMLAFGVETQKVIPYLDAIQNAVAASGGSNDDIAGIAATMSKIQSSAKITAEDLNELGARGVNAAELIGSQMGMTGAQVREAITSGSLDAGVALDALAAGMSDRFEGAAENVKGTFTGAIDRVMAAWRDLSSALAEPFVGSEGGGIFTGLLNETADLMRGFEGLPGPAQGVAAALVAIVGAGALLGGGLILLIPRIAETKAQMEVLRATSPGVAGAVDKTSAAFGFLGKALAAATVAYAAWQLAAREGSTDQVVLGTNEMTSAILDAEGGIKRLDEAFNLKGHTSWLALGQEVGTGVKGLADAFDQLDASGLSRLGDKLTPWKDGFDQASEGIGKLDDQLASLVQSGDKVAASDFMQRLSKETGRSVTELTDYLPAYKDALVGVQNEQDATGDSAEDLASKTASLREEWEASANAALGQRGAAIAAAQAQADANELIAEGVRVVRDATGAIDLNSEASREAESAVNDLAEKYMANAIAMDDGTRSAAELDAALAVQRQSFIDTLIQMGYNETEAAELANTLGLLERTFTSQVDLAKAPGYDAVYNGLIFNLDQLAKPRTAKINVSAGIGLGGLAGVGAPALASLLLGDSYATGGQITGPGTGTSDSILARVSNGEHVLTAADVRAMGGQQNVYKFRETLHSYATGGAVDYRAAAASSFASGGAVSRSTTYAPSVEFNVVGRPTASDQQIGQSAAQELMFKLSASGGVS